MNTSNVTNSVLIQNASLNDIERMIDRAVGERMKAFFESIQEQHPVLVKRKEAAKMLGLSLPTIDAYAKVGILHSRHIGGRVFFDREEVKSLKKSEKKQLKII